MRRGGHVGTVGTFYSNGTVGCPGPKHLLRLDSEAKHRPIKLVILHLCRISQDGSIVHRNIQEDTPGGCEQVEQPIRLCEEPHLLYTHTHQAKP